MKLYLIETVFETVTVACGIFRKTNNPSIWFCRPNLMKLLLRTLKTGIAG